MVNIHYIIKDLAEKCSHLRNIGRDDKKFQNDTEAKIAIGIISAFAKGGYCFGDGTILGFDGKKYVKIDTNEIKKILSGILSELCVGDTYLIKSVDPIYKNLMIAPLITEFKQQSGVVSLRNVVLDMNTMKTYPFGAEWMTRTYMDVDYDPSARCDWWKRWLTEMVADSDSIAVMQEFFGMAFIDRNRISIECVLFLYGKGSNGKSVVQEVIMGLMGDDACDAAELSQICAAGTGDYLAAKLNGKLLNFSSDMGDHDFSGARFKALASHQPIDVRPIYQNHFMARDMPIFAACINKIPVTKDSSYGFWRRPKIITFDKIIPDDEQDKKLSEKILSAESSGILNWIIEGRTRLLVHNGHFTKSDRITDTVAQARVDSSSVLSWLSENLYCGRLKAGQNGYEVKRLSADMIDEYRDYCKKTGCMPKKASNLKDDLEQAGIIYEKCMKMDGKVSTGFRMWKMEYGAVDTGGITAEEKKAVNELPF